MLVFLYNPVPYCSHVCLVLCTCSTFRDQKRESDPLVVELELLAAMEELGMNLGPLQEQQVFITTEPSLQPQVIFLFTSFLSVVSGFF